MNKVTGGVRALKEMYASRTGFGCTAPDGLGWSLMLCLVELLLHTLVGRKKLSEKMSTRWRSNSGGDGREAGQALKPR